MTDTQHPKRPGKRNPLEHWELEALARDLVTRGLATTGILEVNPERRKLARKRRRQERQQARDQAIR